MKVKTNIIISFLVAIIVVIGFFNVPPEKLTYFSISHYISKKLGVAVTTINTTTNLADFPAIYNADIPALNDGKMEISTTTLPLITTLSNLVTTGTLTTGTWNADTLTVAYGGTGSTTLSANQVLLGNGTSGVLTVTGWGTSGQALLSNGGTSAPTWGAVVADQTANYSWTGSHYFNSNIFLQSIFNATGTSYIKNLNASSTAANPMYLNGIDYEFPTTEGASSTALWTDGSGKLIWDNSSTYQCGEQVLTSANATTTVTIAARKDLEIIFDSPGASGAAIRTLTFNTDFSGAGTNYGHRHFISYVADGGTNGRTAIEIANQSTSTAFSFHAKMNNSPTVQKRLTYTATADDLNHTIFTGIGTWNNTTDQVTTINVTTGTASITWDTGTRLTVMCSRD